MDNYNSTTQSQSDRFGWATDMVNRIQANNTGTVVSLAMPGEITTAGLDKNAIAIKITISELLFNQGSTGVILPAFPQSLTLVAISVVADYGANTYAGIPVSPDLYLPYFLNNNWRAIAYQYNYDCLSTIDKNEQIFNFRFNASTWDSEDGLAGIIKNVNLYFM